MQYTNPDSRLSLLNNSPGLLAQLVHDFRATSGGLQDVSSDCHMLHERLCDSLDALAPFAPLDVSLINGLCYAMRAFFVHLGELKVGRPSSSSHWRHSSWCLCFEPDHLDVNADLEEKHLMQDRQLLEQLEYMDALLSAYSQRMLKDSDEQKFVMSETIIGRGSHGTAVFEGHLGTQRVTVKRLLKHFYVVSERELDLLREADQHQNVIRYHHLATDSDFFFLAVELCAATLADVISARTDENLGITSWFDAKEAMRQVTFGLQHLHALGIVHWNIHPRNILVSAEEHGSGQYHRRMVISDFCLYERQTGSPTRTGSWKGDTYAPEMLRGLSRVGGDGSLDEYAGGTSAYPDGHLFSSIDIFALGCVFYFVLSRGDHPFGNAKPELNILNNDMSLKGLTLCGNDEGQATDLIRKMLAHDPSARPSANQCLLHPYLNGRNIAAFHHDELNRPLAELQHSQAKL